MQCMEVWGGNQAVERCFQTPGLRIAIYNRPYGEADAGGDVYYVSSCASGRITRMLLADVIGHGQMVSDTAIALRDLMRRNVNFIQQTRFVREMNQQFARFAEEGGFATALVSTFFAPKQTLALCNAGHPTPLVFRRGESKWLELKNDGQQSSAALADVPLGLFDDADYDQLNVQLETGDMVLSFSDAITESVDGSGRQLGQAGVLRLVRELAVRKMDEIIPALISRLQDLATGNLQQDDATLFLCEAIGGRPSIRSDLLAPFRFFGSVADRTKLG